jgi:hypothetical protein
MNEEAAQLGGFFRLCRQGRHRILLLRHEVLGL